MSTRKIKVIFKTQNGKTYTQEVDTNKTVDRMLADFLENIKAIEKMNEYSFMVRTLPLTKDGVINKKVKYVKQIKPDCIIQVRHVGTLSGALFS